MSTHASKPIIKVPAGDPPTSLIIDDVVTGEGKEATAGCRPVMHYVGVAWSTGQEFDASWDRMETFSFRLGAGEVIGGWDQGVAGMKVGVQYVHAAGVVPVMFWMIVASGLAALTPCT